MLTKEVVLSKCHVESLSDVKKLTLWGSDLENIDIISELTNLEIASLSINKISSLKPFENCANLKELYLRKNNISNIEEIAYLNDLSDKEAIDTFTGTITAYGPDCAGCMGITASGYKVANRTSAGFETITTTYLDEDFGELRILAAARSKFPFGTVIRITGDRINGSISGIVLDTGGAMVNAWNEGSILIDLLFSTEKSQAVYDFGRQRNVKFEVLRYGY